MVSLKRRILAFSTCRMGITLMGTAFNFYYVKIFLTRYHIEENWFHISQVLFLIWNAVNDPLFSYIQDNINCPFTRSRREAILYSAPLFSLAFLVPWFSWGSGVVATGIHLIVALGFWDTMLTYVDLSENCLFAEISTKTEDRLKLLRFSQIGSLIGSSSLLFLEHVSNSLENYNYFQYTCVCIAICNFLLMTFTGLNAYTEYDLKRLNNPEINNSKPNNSDRKSNDPWCSLIKQFFTKDYCIIIVTIVLHEFHQTFLNNFIVIICDQLVPSNVVSTDLRSTFYGAIPMVPKLLVIFCVPLIGHVGYFRAIRYNFIWKICGGVTMFLIGPNHPWCLMMFLLLDSCFGNAIFPLFNMPLSDLADQDMERHKRKHPLTSMLFGTQACFVKPTVSLSPMLVVAILNSHGYSQLKNGLLSSHQMDELKYAMFLLVCAYPLIIGIVQLSVWSMFSIRKKQSTQTLIVTRESENI